MKETKLYFKDGTLFSHDFIRVENGGRGKFVELSKDMLAVDLVSKFNQPLPDDLKNVMVELFNNYPTI